LNPKPHQVIQTLKRLRF